MIALRKNLTARNSLILILALLLSGCSNKKHDIELIQETVEVGTIQSGCELIQRVNQEQIEAGMRDGSKIQTTEGTINCSQTNLNVTGEHVLQFDVYGQEVRKTVVVVDTITPVIHIDEGKFDVDLNNQYFDLLKVIKVTDNYDSSPIVSMNGHYDVSIPGDYSVEIVASDSSGNKSNKNVTIHVKDKEVITIVEEVVVTVPTPVPSSGGNGNSGNDASSGSGSNSGSVNKPPNPGNRSFLFKDGYDIDTGYEACLNYIMPYEGHYKISCKEHAESPGYQAILE